MNELNKINNKLAMIKKEAIFKIGLQTRLPSMEMFDIKVIDSESSDVINEIAPKMNSNNDNINVTFNLNKNI